MKAMISLSPSNDDLPQIYNEMNNDPIMMPPLFSTFKKDKIINFFDVLVMLHLSESA